MLGGLYELIAPHLTEKQRRLLAGAAARALGRGGGARMARISGLSRPTVYAGVRELDDPPDPRGRIRRPGGGPKRLVERNPGLLCALDELVDPDSRGDPQSPLRWTCKSTRQLADALAARGVQVSNDTVGRLLKQQRYTLQRTLKTEEGAPSTPTGTRSSGMSTSRAASSWPPASRSSASTPRRRSWSAGMPTAGGSGGQQASPNGCWYMTSPTRSWARRFPTGSTTWAPTPGWVSVGTDHDTAAFAVATLRRWWQQAGRALYPTATQLLVCADAGGSNGYRVRAWKTELARFAAETGLAVTVCHFPPGTSKWNKSSIGCSATSP